MLFVLAVLVAAAPSARSQVSVDFQDETGDMPGFDSTWMDGFGSGNNIYGLSTSREIRVGRQGTLNTSIARGLVRWDVSSLKGKYTQILGLRLELTVAGTSDANGNDFEVHVVGQADAGWTAAETTKNRKLSPSGYPWRGAVETYGFAAIATGPVRGTASYGPATSAGTKVAIDLTGTSAELTEIVDAWIDSRWSGLLLRATNEALNNSSIRFHSNRATTAAHRPRLTVTYAPGRRVMTSTQATTFLDRYFTSKALTYSDVTKFVTRQGQEDIRFSLLYARLLLETGLAENVQRAEQIIAAVTAQQLNTPGVNASHGYILRNPGQPAGTYHGAPHDFTLSYGLEIRLRHYDQLSVTARSQIDTFNQRAAAWTQNNRVNNTRYITNQRTGVWYALRIAGQIYGNSTWTTLANALLADSQDGLDALIALGGVHEFNSPTYTPLTLHHLDLLAKDATDAALRQKCRRLFQIVWADIGRAFHAPSFQWAGPWSRMYGSTLFTPGGFADTYLGQPSHDVCLVTETRAPAAVLTYFNDPLPAARSVVRTYIPGPATPSATDQVSHHVGSFGVVPIIGTHHHAPAFTLGTLNFARAGHPDAGERRPVVAQWGGAAASSTSSLLLRAMIDGGSGLDDTGRPLIFATQSGGTALIGVTFSTSKADDPRATEPSFTATDLRLRFQSVGPGASVPFSLPGALGGILSKSVSTPQGDTLTIRLQCLLADFTGLTPVWIQNGGNLDLVLYSGAARSFALDTFQRFAAAFSLRLTTTGEPAPSVSLASGPATTELLGGGLRLAFPTRPDTYHVLARTYRDLLLVEPLGTPRDLVCSFNELGRTVLAWLDLASGEIGFELQRRPASQSLWSTLATLPPDTTEYADLSVSPFTDYVYRLRAVGENDAGAWSSELALTSAGRFVPVSELVRALPPGASHPISLNVSNPTAAPIRLTVTGAAAATDYTFQTSDEPGGPVYEWQDISATGTVVLENSASGISQPLALPFTFPFYGASYGSLRVTTAGYVTFTDRLVYQTTANLPSTNAPPAMIALLWGGMRLNPPDGKVFAQTRADGAFVIQFSNASTSDPTSSWTAQLVLRADGEITAHYSSCQLSGPFYAIGIQNEQRNQGITVARNTSVVYPGFSVRYRPPSSWLRFTPGELVLPAGASATLSATFDAEGLADGVEKSMIVTIAAAGTALPVQELPCRMRVSADPRLAWKFARFNAAEREDASFSADEADADGDGLANLLEYALGGDPRAVLSAPKPSLVPTLEGLSFTFGRRRDDVDYVVETSSDLANWSAVAVNPGVVDPAALVAVLQPAAGKVFMRLRVSPR